MSVCLIVCKYSFCFSPEFLFQQDTTCLHKCKCVLLFFFTMQSVLWLKAPLNGGGAVLFTAWKYIFLWHFLCWFWRLFVQMPILEVDGKTCVQTGAIARWLSAETHWSVNLEKVRIIITLIIILNIQVLWEAVWAVPKGRRLGSRQDWWDHWHRHWYHGDRHDDHDVINVV